MSRCVVRLCGEATGPIKDEAECWLVSYDPEAFAGIGHIVTTADRKQATVFDDASIPLAMRQAIPKNRPTRPDGRPNRPLSAYHLGIESVEP